MKHISVYDIEADAIEKICYDNDMTEAELVELMMEYIDQIKEENGLI